MTLLSKSVLPRESTFARFSRINVTCGSYATCETEGKRSARELSTPLLSDNNRRCTCTRGDRDKEREWEIRRGRDTYAGEMPRRKQCIPLLARQWDLRNLVSALNPLFLRPRCISRSKTHVIYSRTEFASGGHNVARNVFAIQINHVANTKCAWKKICPNMQRECFSS